MAVWRFVACRAWCGKWRIPVTLVARARALRRAEKSISSMIQKLRLIRPLQLGTRSTFNEVGVICTRSEPCYTLNPNSVPPRLEVFEVLFWHSRSRVTDRIYALLLTERLLLKQIAEHKISSHNTTRAPLFIFLVCVSVLFLLLLSQSRAFSKSSILSFASTSNTSVLFLHPSSHFSHTYVSRGSRGSQSCYKIVLQEWGSHVRP